MIMATLIGFISTFTNYPVGSYYANVKIPMLSKQEIYVDIYENSSGKIYLKGPITQEDSFFYNNKNEKPILGDKIIKILNKYNCKLLNVQYNFENDIAHVNLNLPIVGNTFLKMQKVKTF